MGGGQMDGGKASWEQEFIVKKLDSDISNIRNDLNQFRAEVKEDFKNFRAEVKEEFKKVREEINDVRTELKTEINSVRTELKTEIGDVKKETRAFSRWAISAFITMIVGFISVLAAVLGR